MVALMVHTKMRQRRRVCWWESTNECPISLLLTNFAYCGGARPISPRRPSRAGRDRTCTATVGKISKQQLFPRSHLVGVLDTFTHEPGRCSFATVTSSFQVSVCEFWPEKFEFTNGS
jgi:hypothetical protein